MGNRSPVQKAAFAVGLVFLLVGIAGFIPGITTNYDDLSFVGHDGAKLLGIFEVNILHNIVHLLFAVGIPMAATASKARAYLIGGGIAYLVVLVFGLVVDRDSDVNFIAINTADNWLHLGLAALMLLLGTVLGRGTARNEVAGGGAHRV